MPSAFSSKSRFFISPKWRRRVKLIKCISPDIELMSNPSISWTDAFNPYFCDSFCHFSASPSEFPLWDPYKMCKSLFPSFANAVMSTSDTTFHPPNKQLRIALSPSFHNHGGVLPQDSFFLR